MMDNWCVICGKETIGNNKACLTLECQQRFRQQQKERVKEYYRIYWITHKKENNEDPDDAIDGCEGVHPQDVQGFDEYFETPKMIYEGEEYGNG